jgi:prepilin-type N-terminal cleavage/methylation domain-containing protein
VSDRRAFTLIELLVVLGVIALLIGIAIPTLTGAIAKTRDTRCLAQLKGFGPAFQSFRNDNRGQLPYADINASFPRGWTRPWDQLAEYIDVPLPRADTTAGTVETWPPFVCPSDRTLAERHGVSYWYGLWQMMGIMGQAETTIMVERDPASWALLHDGDDFHRPRPGESGKNRLKLDGSVDRTPLRTP